MLHTKFHASEPSGSQIEEFSNIFICISLLKTKDPEIGAILDLQTFFEQTGEGLPNFNHLSQMVKKRNF